MCNLLTSNSITLEKARNSLYRRDLSDGKAPFFCSSWSAFLNRSFSILTVTKTEKSQASGLFYPVILKFRGSETLTPSGFVNFKISWCDGKIDEDWPVLESIQKPSQWEPAPDVRPSNVTELPNLLLLACPRITTAASFKEIRSVPCKEKLLWLYLVEK